MIFRFAGGPHDGFEAPYDEAGEVGFGAVYLLPHQQTAAYYRVQSIGVEVTDGNAAKVVFLHFLHQTPLARVPNYE